MRRRLSLSHLIFAALFFVKFAASIQDEAVVSRARILGEATPVEERKNGSTRGIYYMPPGELIGYGACKNEYQRCRSASDCCSGFCFVASPYDRDGLCKELPGNLPLKELSGNLPLQELSGNFPLKELSGNFPLKELPGNLPLLGQNEFPQVCRPTNGPCRHSEECCTNFCSVEGPYSSLGTCREIAFPYDLASRYTCKGANQRCGDRNECCSKICNFRNYHDYYGTCADELAAISTLSMNCADAGLPCFASSECCPQFQCARNPREAMGRCIQIQMTTPVPLIYPNFITRATNEMN